MMFPKKRRLIGNFSFYTFEPTFRKIIVQVFNKSFLFIFGLLSIQCSVFYLSVRLWERTFNKLRFKKWDNYWPWFLVSVEVCEEIMVLSSELSSFVVTFVAGVLLLLDWVVAGAVALLAATCAVTDVLDVVEESELIAVGRVGCDLMLTRLYHFASDESGEKSARLIWVQPCK